MGDAAELGRPNTAVVVMGEGVTAASGLPPSIDVILWESVPTESQDSRTFSLPLLVDHREHELRREYLQWLVDFAGGDVAGTDVETYLCIRPDLSYWWMSLPSQFTFWPDSPVLQIVKMLALADLCEERGTEVLVIYGGTGELIESIARWGEATQRRVRFASSLDDTLDLVEGALSAEGRSSSGRRVARSTRHRFGIAVDWARAVVSFVRLAVQELLRGPGRTRDLAAIERQWSGVAIFDYLGPLEATSLSERRFRSRYWGPLVSTLTEHEGSVWLHRRVTGTSWIDVKPASPSEQQIEVDGALHVDVTRPQSLSSRMKAIGLGLRVAWRGLRIAHNRELFRLKDTGIDVWPLVRVTWLRCFLGSNGLANLLWMYGIEEDLKRLPRQDLGVFLLEDQPWEIALMSAWSRAGHGVLVGYAHTTVRFWDLRYAVTGLSLASSAQKCPLPHVIASNGPAATRALRELGVPGSLLVEVEAVRYLDSIDREPAVPALEPHDGPRERFLVLGEYEHGAVRRQLRMVDDAVVSLSLSARVSFRPHPSADRPAMPSDLFALTPIGSTLDDSLAIADGVLVGETSSVVIEALMSGKPVAILADPVVLPTNPLRMSSSVTVVRTVHDLISWMRAVSSGMPMNEGDFDPNDVLLLDPGLARWRNLLSSFGADSTA